MRPLIIRLLAVSILAALTSALATQHSLRAQPHGNVTLSEPFGFAQGQLRERRISAFAAAFRENAEILPLRFAQRQNDTAAGFAHPLVSPILRALAARAQTHRGWNALARYARSTRSEDTRGLAWFTLGYRQYKANEGAAAAANLKRAASTGFELSDYAEYYEALADQQTGRDDDAVTVLAGFNGRYPDSVLWRRVEGALASSLIQAGHPEKALEVLGSGPPAQTSGFFLLLTAQAEEALNNDLAAAQVYQQIYVSFPDTPEDEQAQAALKRLRRQMGYPPPSEEAESERADRLLRRGLYGQALSSYQSLLLKSPRSPHRAEWRNRQAECLLALRRYPGALTALSEEDKKRPKADAERLALRVRAYELSDDQPSLLGALDELYRQYPRSRFYADALIYAGGYFARQGFWPAAARYYAPLANAFPESLYAPLAAWRVAWYDLLGENAGAAQGALVGFLRRYPDSAFTPAALYWLATTETEEGDSDPAQEIFRLLAAQYASTYYGLEARAKLPKGEALGRVRSGLPASDVALASLGIELPARSDPPGGLCGASRPGNLLRPFVTLAALSLDDLASQYLAEAAALHPRDTRLLLASARLEASMRDTSAALFSAKRAVPDYEVYPFDALPEEVWRLLYPQTYWSLVRRYARASGIDPYLVMGLIRQESAFDPRARSSARARGLMQMEPGTATERVRGRLRKRRIALSLYRPAYNIRAGCLYLRGLLREFHNNVPQALAAYNAGDIRTSLWVSNSKVNDPAKFLETIPFTDTRAYVEMVLRDRIIYRDLLTGRARFARCPARGGR